jgi:hypothetical protein
MGLISNLLGTPKEHNREKSEHEVVKTPEFDITQYAKKLGVSAGIVLGAVIAALKAAKVEEVTDPAVLVGVLAVVAAAFLGTSLVMAIDLAARAYLAGAGSAGGEDEAADNSDSEVKESGSKAIPAPAGMMVWLPGDDGPHPVLAMNGDGEKATSYLVAAGSTVERTAGDKSVKAIDGTPSWHSADQIRAVRPAKWP